MDKTTATVGGPTRRTYPSAFYAAAGVGDLAYRQLRKLPEMADRLRMKASELAVEAQSQAPQWRAKATQVSEKATSVAAEFTSKVDPAQMRDAIVTGTQTAADKATKLYSSLVVRGEQAFTESAEHLQAQPAQRAEAADAQVTAEDQPTPAKNGEQRAEAKPAAKRRSRGDK